jgi:hypothetical protein
MPLAAAHGVLSAAPPARAGRRRRQVMHGCANDISWLQQLGCYVVNVLDTEKAAQVLGKEERSLASLLRVFLGVPQDKRHQAADWRARPLPPALRAYARADVHWLLQLADCLVVRLVAEGAAGGAAADAAAKERARDKRRARRRAADAAALGGLVPQLPEAFARPANGGGAGAGTTTAESDAAAGRRGGGGGGGDESSSDSEEPSGDEAEGAGREGQRAAAASKQQGPARHDARVQQLQARLAQLEARLAHAEGHLGMPPPAKRAPAPKAAAAAAPKAVPALPAAAAPVEATKPARRRPAPPAGGGEAAVAGAAAAPGGSGGTPTSVADFPLLASASRKSQAMTQRLWQKTPAATAVRNAAAAVLRRHWQQLAMQQRLREGLAGGATPTGLVSPPPGLATPPPGLATPPPGLATPPGGLALPRGLATPPPGLATPPPGLATPPPGLATPPGWATPPLAGTPRALAGAAGRGPDPDAEVLAVRDAVYALCAWRDAAAHADDEGPQYVLLDAALLDLARRPPRGARELVERAAAAARAASAAAAAASPVCPQRYDAPGPVRRDAKRLVALISDARAGLLPAPDVHGDPLLGAATGGHAGRGAGRAAGGANAAAEADKEERRRQRMISKFSVKSQVGGGLDFPWTPRLICFAAAQRLLRVRPRRPSSAALPGAPLPPPLRPRCTRTAACSPPTARCCATATPRSCSGTWTRASQKR